MAPLCPPWEPPGACSPGRAFFLASLTRFLPLWSIEPPSTYTHPPPPQPRVHAASRRPQLFTATANSLSYSLASFFSFIHGLTLFLLSILSLVFFPPPSPSPLDSLLYVFILIYMCRCVTGFGATAGQYRRLKCRFKLLFTANLVFIFKFLSVPRYMIYIFLPPYQWLG